MLQPANDDTARLAGAEIQFAVNNVDILRQSEHNESLQCASGVNELMESITDSDNQLRWRKRLVGDVAVLVSDKSIL